MYPVMTKAYEAKGAFDNEEQNAIGAGAAALALGVLGVGVAALTQLGGEGPAGSGACATPQRLPGQALDDSGPAGSSLQSA